MRSFALSFVIVSISTIVFADCDSTLTPSYTSNIGLAKPDINSCSWGVVLNNDWGIVDSSVAVLSRSNSFTGSNNSFSGLTASSITVSGSNGFLMPAASSITFNSSYPQEMNFSAPSALSTSFTFDANCGGVYENVDFGPDHITLNQQVCGASAYPHLDFCNTGVCQSIYGDPTYASPPSGLYFLAVPNTTQPPLFVGTSSVTVNAGGFNSNFGIKTSTIAMTAFNTTTTSATVTGTAGLAIANISPTGSYEIQSSTTSTFFHVAISTSGHVLTGGKVPTVSSCGSGSPSVVGDDNQGIITVGGTAPTACTLTFANTWGSNANVRCNVTDNSLTITADISSLTSTALTLGFGVGGLAGGTVYYNCGCSGSSCR